MKQYNKTPLLSLVFTLSALFGGAFLPAQSMRILDVVVQEGGTLVEVPILISAPDSAAAIQFSIIWPPEKLRLDSLKVSPVLQNGNFTVLSNRLGDNEIRVIVVPVIATGLRDFLVFEEDSAAFRLSFELLRDFKGSAEVRFNPDFPTAFSDNLANHIPATVQNGTITYSGNPTSNQRIDAWAELIQVSPNPVQNQLRITGFPASDRLRSVHLLDNLGRKCWSGQLTDAPLALPESLGNGLYWLVLDLRGGICTKRVVVLR